jgi:hypothetical protein
VGEDDPAQPVALERASGDVRDPAPAQRRGPDAQVRMQGDVDPEEGT